MPSNYNFSEMTHVFLLVALYLRLHLYMMQIAVNYLHMSSIVAPIS